MHDQTDSHLLACWAESRSEPAFAELVRRHVDFVYSVALRMVCDSHLAEDVTQSVFVALAKDAASITHHRVLSSWLHRAAQNIAAQTVRTDVRRRAREQEAATMNELVATEVDPPWEHIAPHLDAALGELTAPDRDAVLLRYFENKSLREVGQALGTSDDTAQKRVSRAVERLREFFAKRGITVGASGLVLIITANAVQAAPTGLAVTISSAVLAGVATTGGALTILKLVTATKLKLGVVSVAIIAVVLVGILLRRDGKDSNGRNNSAGPSTSENASSSAVTGRFGGRVSSGFPRSEADAAPAATAQEIVTSKLARFGKSRRDLVDALARRHGVEVPDAVKLFFDAVESGNWDEIEARFKVINGGDSSAGHAAGRPPGVEHLWPAIIDAYGAAEQAHLWPAQKLLDYGNAVLESLRPGMVYVGGTDNGRWIPELLNDTSDDERHIVVTQNGLADGAYLDYLNLQYSERFATLTQEDSQRVFQEYLSDAQQRLLHDQQFPDEPKQIRPGEDIRTDNGQIQISGAVAVMAVNESLLRALMAKNPDLSFALQESFPLKGTYAEAIPLGPLMELGVQDAQNAFTAERATQSLDYWRSIAEKILADPEASASPVTLKSYSHDLNAAANLLAANNYSGAAEEAYRLASQLWAGNPEPVAALAQLLANAGRSDQGRQLLEDFARDHPDIHYPSDALWKLVVDAPPEKPSK